MSRAQQTGTGVSWQHPLGAHPANAERWKAFCATIDDRIRQVREDEVHESWRCFGTDMEDFGAPIALPIGRVMPRPGERGYQPGWQPAYRRSA